MLSNKPLKPEPKKILVIAMPYLGDVLLATPVWHSLRIAYPLAQIDALVFEDTKGMLQGNPDINQIITTQRRPTFAQKWALFLQIFRQYDLAIAIQTADRPFFYTLFASSFRVNAVPPKPKAWWKRYFAQRWTEFDNEQTHTVLQNLKVLDLISVPKQFDLVPPKVIDSTNLEKRYAFLQNNRRFVVLHPLPQFQYKRWTLAGWLEIGRYLDNLGFTLVLSGGPAEQEVAYLNDLAKQLSGQPINLAGQVSLPELADIIKKSALFIGPDTGITHLAAATGIPVIALFGPTNPVKWAPWPSGYQLDNNPFQKVGCQQVNNVTLIQGEATCAPGVPCHAEGCDRHRQSHSQCLDTLPAAKVIAAIKQLQL
jgi:heptosyltransferase-3